jgi:hypothetical protein
MIFSNPDMMVHVEAIFLIKGQHTIFYSLTTTRQLFSKIQRSMGPTVMIAKGWENLL